jgi:hypothetical protein
MDKRTYLILLLTIALLGCDKGISPSDTPEVKPGFGGTITFVSPPPPRDSLIQLRIIAVPYYPIDTVVETLIQKIVQGVIPFSDTLQLSSIDSGKTQRYEFIISPGEYKYVAVVQQYGLLLYEEWRVISIYGFSQSTPFPRPVTVAVDKFQTGIDFIVDFKNLPPQPFKR